METLRQPSSTAIKPVPKVWTLWLPCPPLQTSTQRPLMTSRGKACTEWPTVWPTWRGHWTPLTSPWTWCPDLPTWPQALTTQANLPRKDRLEQLPLRTPLHPNHRALTNKTLTQHIRTTTLNRLTQLGRGKMLEGTSTSSSGDLPASSTTGSSLLITTTGSLARDILSSNTTRRFHTEEIYPA